MKRILTIAAAIFATLAAVAQTLNVQQGTVTYQFPASQTGVMNFDGSTMTIMGKTFTLGDITAMSVDDSEVTDNQVTVRYDGTAASVTIAGNVAQYVEATVSGAHVSIAQTNTDAVDDNEITYVLTGSSSDGELSLEGSYKCTLSLDGLTLTNPGGAALNITNGKRIQISAKSGTENTLTDGSGGSQKGCIYSKGQIQLQGKGTLNVAGNTKHAIKSGDYISVKNLTLNITKAVGDGISCNEYFLMKSGTVSISGVGDDGIQCDLDGDTSTGETEDHEDEDSGNIYLEDGTLTVTVTGAATKGIKAVGDMNISGGTLNITTTGSAAWDSDDSEVKACAAMSADGKMAVSGGTLTLKSTGAGGKAISVDGTLSISGGNISAITSGQIAYCSSTSNTTIRTTTSSNTTERLADALKASPKAIKADGAMTVSGGMIYAKASYHEALETKSTLDVTGGVIYAYSSDDAINSASTMTLSGGFVGGYSTGNDAIDSNGNLYIKGATVFAYTTKSSPEVAIDANTEGGYKLYVQSGTLYAYPSLESGSSLTQSCYTASLSTGYWYSFTQSGTAFAFKVPASGTWIVSGGSSLYRVSMSSGTTIFGDYGATDATVSSGSSVSLTAYTGGGGGGGGFRPWH